MRQTAAFIVTPASFALITFRPTSIANGTRARRLAQNGARVGALRAITFLIVRCCSAKLAWALIWPIWRKPFRTRKKVRPRRLLPRMRLRDRLLLRNLPCLRHQLALLRNHPEQRPNPVQADRPQLRRLRIPLRQNPEHHRQLHPPRQRRLLRQMQLLRNLELMEHPRRQPRLRPLPRLPIRHQLQIQMEFLPHILKRGIIAIFMRRKA